MVKVACTKLKILKILFLVSLPRRFHSERDRKFNCLQKMHNWILGYWKCVPRKCKYLRKFKYVAKYMATICDKKK